MAENVNTQSCAGFGQFCRIVEKQQNEQEIRAISQSFSSAALAACRVVDMSIERQLQLDFKSTGSTIMQNVAAIGCDTIPDRSLAVKSTTRTSRVGMRICGSAVQCSVNWASTCNLLHCSRSTTTCTTT